MKKIFSASFAVLVFICFFGIARAADFTDVPQTHKNAEAIYYLQKENIIKGYGDNTFKPDAKVNRAEFLKIILEGSDIELNVSEYTKFSDINENAWYAPYVKKAKKEGWIQGYADGTFRPESFINKAEALKILGKVQEWKISSSVKQAPFKDVPALAWYAGYVEYAKARNFLEAGGVYLQPNVEMSRAKISEIIYRTLIYSDEEALNDNKESAPEIAGATEEEVVEEEKIEVINFIPVEPKTYAADYFEKVVLESEPPNTFYKNEIYTLKGEILEGTYSTIFAFTNKDSVNKNYSADVSNKKFEIEIYFEEIGNFKLGIIPGTQGTSKIMNISVLPALPETKQDSSETAKKADSLDIIFENDKTTFSWKNPSDIQEITISQGAKKKKYISRQKKTSLSPEFKNFKDFKEGAVQFQVKTANMGSMAPLEINSEWQTSNIKEIEAVQHKFSEIEDDKITHSSIPETMIIPQKIQFAGVAKEVLLRDAAIIVPSGEVEKIKLSGTEFGDYYGSETIKKGFTYTFEYTPKEEGTYILEINEQIGYAVINKAVYIGKSIPLIPDFFDLQEPIVLVPGNINIENTRNEILELINQERKSMGVQEVELSDELNTLAQNHTEDMVKNNFFGHVNLQGQLPDDRRIALGITTEVGENLAKAGSIAYAHEGLLRSAIHRQNIIDENWTRVGIGVKKDKEGYYILTEEFSKTPLTESSIPGMEQEITDHINNERTGSIQDIIINETLKDMANTWSAKMIQQDFLGFTAPDGTKLEDLIDENDITVQVQAFVVQGSSVDAIKSKILTDTKIEEADWNSMGISLKLNSDGKLKFTMLYTH